MWNSGALAVFDEARLDGFKRDGGKPDGNAELHSCQGTSGGQRSPGGTEYIDLPGQNIFTGTEMNDDWMSFDADAILDTRAFAPDNNNESYNFSTPGDQSYLAVAQTEHNTYQNSMSETTTGHDCLSPTLFSMGETPLHSSRAHICAPKPQLHHGDFKDFEFPEPLAFNNANFFEQTMPVPKPPLSPALTPPPSSSCSDLPGTASLSVDTDDQRWDATLARSRAADRLFLYGVMTTKIYCRPSCPSRRPARKHVTFFPFPGAIEAAVHADFRPCKRCKPESLGNLDTSVLGVVKVLRMIIDDASKPFSSSETDTRLETLAIAGGLSAFHFHRLFKATTQLTPGEFIAGTRSLSLGDTLGKDAQPSLAAAKVTNLVNNSAKWRPRTARKALGAISPTEYANGAPNLKIERVSIGTPQGPMCIAYSPAGDIFAVLLGLDAEDRMHTRFPSAFASESHAEQLGRCVSELHQTGVDREDDIPVDVRPMLWRARIWVKLVRDSVLGGGQDVR